MNMSQILEETIQLQVSDGTIMQAFIARPASKPSAGILVFQEAFGVNHHIRQVTINFALEGYLAVAPELFHRTAHAGFEGSYDNFQPLMPHIQALTPTGTIADAKCCFDWLESQGIKKTGAAGYCMGGRVAYVANSALPIKAAVSYYGSQIASPENLARAKDQQGPLLLHWGGADKHIPPDEIRAIEDALRTAGKSFVNVVYSGADHGFNCDARPSYNAEAAAESWALTQAFLKKHLA
jgi:carboxymethylenebutenolidase